MARYGTSGFTQKDEIQAIMRPLREAEEWGGMIRFSGLSVADGRRLLDLLPAVSGEDRQNYAPSFAQFVQGIGVLFPNALFFGYQITPQREDERITIEGILIPRAHLAREIEERLIGEFADAPPDEFTHQKYKGEDYWRLWWD